MYQEADIPREQPREQTVVTNALWFVAAGPISERERKMPSVNI